MLLLFWEKILALQFCCFFGEILAPKCREANFWFSTHQVHFLTFFGRINLAPVKSKRNRNNQQLLKFLLSFGFKKWFRKGEIGKTKVEFSVPLSFPMKRDNLRREVGTGLCSFWSIFWPSEVAEKSPFGSRARIHSRDITWKENSLGTLIPKTIIDIRLQYKFLMSAA